ncbi:MAG: HAMP domain-containing histidine kinase [Calditrichaeota bacterium]|nr:HAMP domain-containing histidine kinase [Calditrichota bacterium]
MNTNRPHFGAFMHSLKFRLMVLITLALLIVVGGPMILLIHILDANYQEFTINMLETTSQVVYQAIYAGMLQNNRQAIQKNLELISLEPTIRSVRIYRMDGTIIFSSDSTEIYRKIQDLSRDVLVDRDKIDVKEAYYTRGHTYSHHHGIYIQEECTPCHKNRGELIAIMDLHVILSQSEQMYLTAKRLTIFSTGISVVVLWLVLNFMYHGQIETRLKRIIQGFDRLAEGDFQVQVRMPGRHELAMLAQKFNTMVERLKAAREREENLLREKIERADRLVTLGEIAAEIAHEVNNPASIILTRAEYLKGELEDQLADRQFSQDLDMIIHQTQKIADTTRSILHYARKRPRTFEPCELGRIIQQSLKVLEPLFHQKRVRVEFQPPREPACLLGNAAQLEQVFCNLITNALHAVERESGQITVVLESGSDVHRVIICDNGPGVPEEFRDKIFSPFFTTRRNGEGTGLGLFIAKNIVEHHNGRIYLKDASQGATFVVELEATHEKC